MNRIKQFLLILSILIIISACNFLSSENSSRKDSNTPPPESSPTQLTQNLPEIQVKPNNLNPSEPVIITGDIPYSSPFFVSTLSQPFVLLEDEAGFVERNIDFPFNLQSQVIGPVIIHEDNSLTYELSLPSIPQGTYKDVDQNNQDDKGVQIFAIAYWSNIWDGPFLEPRDGTGWSTAYSSTITDPDTDGEIVGGTLIVWAPDDNQGFPTGFGADNLLFTKDDPISTLQAGYNVIDLSTTPFQVSKEPNPNITLIEGDIAVNDFSDLPYEESFEKLFQKVSKEYPFTKDKNIDWQALYNEFAPRIRGSNNKREFYQTLHDFTLQIPDGHINLSIDPDDFYEKEGGGFGLVLAQLSNGKIIAKHVINNLSADKKGIKKGAEIITWNNEPVQTAIEKIVPYFGPYSTEDVNKLKQIDFLTRVPPGTDVEVSFINPGEITTTSVKLISEVEYESIFKTIPSIDMDPLSLPIESHTIEDSEIGYIQITTFSDDYHLMAQLWERYIQTLIDEDTEGLIIDIRNNNGGSTGLAMDFAGFLFSEDFTLYKSSYYNEKTNEFEYTKYKPKVHIAPITFKGKVVVLIGPNCISACEGFAYALTHNNRATIIGHYPSAGAFGEVGRGQYILPDDLKMQFPTGRPETQSGELLIEGSGIAPDILVPVTMESVLGNEDNVLQAAIDFLRNK